MKKILCAFLLLFFTNLAIAAPVAWTLNAEANPYPYPFTAVGGFTYDADLNLYSNINLTGVPYPPAFPWTILEASASHLSATSFDFNSNPVMLVLYFEIPLTNSGGNIPLVVGSGLIPYSEISGYCALPGCKEFISGSVTAVPLPGALILLGSALGLLGCVRRLVR